MFNEKYINAQNPESMPGPGLVIGCYNPYWVAKVIQFKTAGEMSEFMVNDPRAELFQKCEGYRVGLIILGSLHPCPRAFCSKYTRNAIANFYLHSKIQTNEGNYKKYREAEQREKAA